MIRRLLRRWWVRWIVLPLVALSAAHAGWTLVLKWRFERRLDELRAAGAPVDLRDLARPPIPDEDNAAALWEEAHRWYEEHVEPRLIQFSYDPEELDDEDREVIAQWIAKADPYVDLLARAAAKPDLWEDLDWEAGPAMRVTTLPQMQEASMLLLYRIRFANRAMPEDLREVSILLDLAPKVERPLVLLMLVRWVVEGIAADSLEALAAKPGFDAREARAILDPRFAATDDRAHPREAFQGERVFALSLSRRWIGGEGPTHWAGDDERSGTFGAFLLDSWLARPLAYRDGLRLLDLAERAMTLLDQTPRDALPAAEALEAECGDPSRRSTVPKVLAPIVAKILRQRMRHQSRMRIARVGLALLELRQQAGAWPETLDAVVPLIGEEWVEDPYTGERLEYEPGARVEAAVPIADEQQREYDEIVWRFGS